MGVRAEDGRLPRPDLAARRWRAVAQSKAGTILRPDFRSLPTAAETLPCNTLLDGDIVIADESDQADFGALQQRLTLARKFIAQASRHGQPSCSFSMFWIWRATSSRCWPFRTGDGGSRSCSRLAILASSPYRTRLSISFSS